MPGVVQGYKWNHWTAIGSSQTILLFTYLPTYLLTYLFIYLLTYLLITYLLTYLLTYSMEVLPEKLTGFHLDKKFPAFMEPESSLPYSQVPATCPYPEPARSLCH
jgi:hypothetical protein